jgi:hypothetical protein
MQERLCDLRRERQKSDGEAVTPQVSEREANMEFIVIILVEIGLLAEALRRIPVLTASAALMIYLILGESIYWLLHIGVVPISAILPAAQYGLYKYGTLFLVTLISIFLDAWISTLGMKFSLLQGYKPSAATSDMFNLLGLQSRSALPAGCRFRSRQRHSHRFEVI